MSSEPLGGKAWERAGGPPLSFAQRLSVLSGAAVVIAKDLGPRVRYLLGQWGILSPVTRPPRVDLGPWVPPDTRAAREAEQYMREVSSLEMVYHSLRTYYFSGIMYDLSGTREAIDREALYVGAALHDVGLFQPAPPSVHCFTVGGAREARRIAKDAGWDEARADRAAAAITSNLNSFVPIETFGVEAHFLRVGGLIEVIAQEWKVHPDNLEDILQRFPRDNFAADSLAHVRQEIRRHPRGRFACLDPLFPILVRNTKFSLER